MTKKELIKIISETTGFTKTKSSIILNSMIDIIKTSLKVNENVVIKDFGAFKIHTKKAKKFYNFKTQTIDVKHKHKTVKFVAYKSLNKCLNNESSKDSISIIHPVSNKKKGTHTDYISTDINYSGTNIQKGAKNIGKRRVSDTTEIHNHKFEYIGKVKFDHYLGEEDHTEFPSVKTPLLNTKILKWYKSNKDAVIGISEPLLTPELEKLCKKYDGLELLEKVALPIRNREYSYRPDVALYWGKYNVCIDIEIDEPYDISSRKPTHYIGCSDNLRDTYFTRNGWCVIRYSESQIIDNLSEVIEHLDFVLNWLVDADHKKYKLPIITRWTYEEAIKMSDVSTREENLKIELTSPYGNEQSIITDDRQIFVKTNTDILPKIEIKSKEYIISSQIDLALASNARYLRITMNNGYQWMLNKETVKKGIEDNKYYITGESEVSPFLSDSDFQYQDILQIQPINNLFTDEHWVKGCGVYVKHILISAASKGSPIWIKYQNSQGDISERYVSDIFLYLYEMNDITNKIPFTHLGEIVNTDMTFYLYGYCSKRKEHRSFATDFRIKELKVVNCKNSFIFHNVYRDSLAELIMNPYSYKKHLFNCVDYLLSIIPKEEKENWLSVGNIANYDVICERFSSALSLYTSKPFSEVIGEKDGEKICWGRLCEDDIDNFINESIKKEDSQYDYDVVPSKMETNFKRIKQLLIDYGWEW